MEIIFWISFALLLHTYVGYPAILLCLGNIRQKAVKRAPIQPMISIIIAAHNEEASVVLKLENTLALHYPKEKLEILFVSDGSTDRTTEIASQYEPLGVTCIDLPEWMGKAVALNHAVRMAKGEILIFTDIGAVAQPDCLEQLVANFADPKIGCVSTENHIVAQGSGGSEGLYMKYLMFLRRLESNFGSCTCVCGSFYAIRKELCPEFPSYGATDLLSVLETFNRGFRTVSDPSALVSIGSVRTQKEEFRRKTRTVMTGVACLPAMLPLLNPFRSKLFSLKLMSHKILRWTGGLFLISLFAANALLYDASTFYQIAFGTQLAFYTLALVGAMSESLAASYAAVRLPYFLVYTHISALIACFKYAMGERVSTWQPSKRETRRIPS